MVAVNSAIGHNSGSDLAGGISNGGGIVTLLKSTITDNATGVHTFQPTVGGI